MLILLVLAMVMICLSFFYSVIYISPAVQTCECVQAVFELLVLSVLICKLTINPKNLTSNWSHFNGRCSSVCEASGSSFFP